MCSHGFSLGLAPGQQWFWTLMERTEGLGFPFLLTSPPQIWDYCFCLPQWLHVEPRRKLLTHRDAKISLRNSAVWPGSWGSSSASVVPGVRSTALVGGYGQEPLREVLKILKTQAPQQRLFLKIFIYYLFIFMLFERQREIFHLLVQTPQTCLIARVKPGWSQEPRTQSRFPT